MQLLISVLYASTSFPIAESLRWERKISLFSLCIATDGVWAYCSYTQTLFLYRRSIFSLWFQPPSPEDQGGYLYCGQPSSPLWGRLGLARLTVHGPCDGPWSWVWRAIHGMCNGLWYQQQPNPISKDWAFSGPDFCNSPRGNCSCQSQKIHFKFSFLF